MNQLSPERKLWERMQAFNRTRAIPFAIPLKFSDLDQCCSGKAELLKKWFIASGYEAKYRVVDFKWSKLGLPPIVLAVPHPDDCTHAYVEVLIDDRWVKVDPTWDPGIASVLPTSEWDGINDTKIAVPVEQEYSDEESVKLMEFNEQEFGKDIAINGEFYKAVNEWLENVRKLVE